MSATIYTAQEITLVTLQRCSANMADIENIFDRIAKLDVNVDMISMAPAHGRIWTLAKFLALRKSCTKKLISTPL